jgi:D-alanyl-D-alanine carboxypeptidase (penicillin-binding protein 5/6)
VQFGKLTTAVLLFTVMLFSQCSVAFGLTVNARAAVLMDPVSGKVLYAQNENQRLPPASVTKVMTMLLILEAVHHHKLTWNEKITVSRTAESMGGSQVYLKEGEEFTLRQLFETIAVVSANDASAAVAEYLYGSIEDFVDMMNRRTKTLGLKNTHFANETGLPDPQHYSSAYDLAVISRELLKYPEVLDFTSIWLDTFRDGKFTLRNTNELLKVYRGVDGLKTGHTAEAKFCLSATAKKGKFRLLSVILGADTDAKRVSETKKLLDYGYRNYQWQIIKKADTDVGKIYVKNAQPQNIPVKIRSDFGAVVERGMNQLIETQLIPVRNLKLPLKPGQSVGVVKALVKGKTVGITTVYSLVKVKRAGFLVRWWRQLRDFVTGLFHRNNTNPKEIAYGKRKILDLAKGFR